MGKMQTGYSLALEENYNDNILLTHENEKEDFITKIIPTLSLQDKNERYEYSLGYNFNAIFYARNPRENKNKHTVSGAMKAGILDKYLYLDLSDNYSRTLIDVRRANLEEELYVNFVDTNTLTVSPYLIHLLSDRSEIKTGYVYSEIRYIESDLSDVNDHSAYISYMKPLSNFLRASIGYVFLRKGGEDINQHYDMHKLTVSAKYQISPATKTDLSFGKGWIDYKVTKENGEYFWNMSLENRFNSQGAITLGVSQDISEAPLTGTQRTSAGRISVQNGDRFRFKTSLYGRRTDYLFIGRRDDVIGFNLGLTSKISKLFSMTLDTDDSRQKYSLPDEKVNLWNIGLRGNYILAHPINVQLGYKYSRRDSDIERNSYDNNIVFFSIRTNF